ncbi:hypothetical protein GCM10020219_035060 [Nonomuraea dietziae]
MGVPLPQGERVDVDRIAAGAVEAIGETRFAAEFAVGGGLLPADAIK